MSRVTVERAKPTVNPIESVTLKLTLEEAQFIRTLLGAVPVGLFDSKASARELKEPLFRLNTIKRAGEKVERVNLPLKSVTITLTYDEAQLVRDLLGATTGDVGSFLFDTLIGIEELNSPYRVFTTIDIEAATPVAPTGE